MKRSILSLLCTFTLGTMHAQVSGMWEFTKVTLGDEEVTPVAKWTRLNEDGTFQSGNGWVQNAEGTWNYDKESKSFLPVTKNGITDEFGPFEVSFTGDGLTWKRKEEGMEVVVSLRRINEIPKGPMDEIVGLWDLDDAQSNGRNILDEMDPGLNRYLFIRWDRIFVFGNTPDGRLTGYWHFDGHRPQVTLIYHDSARDREYWNVSYEDGKMIWNNSEFVELTFSRIGKFPE